MKFQGEKNNSGKNKILKFFLTYFDFYKGLLWKLAKLFMSTKIQFAQSIIESGSVNDGAVIDYILVEEDYAKTLDGWSDEMKNHFLKVKVGNFQLTLKNKIKCLFKRILI